MGQSLSLALPSILRSRQNMRMLMVGLDAAGKTTMLYKMGRGEVTTLIPTIGLNIETVTHRTSERITSLNVWDVGGRCPMRMLWRHYYKDTDALIFVVDSSDLERMEQAKDELDYMVTEDELRHKPLLVFANKQDLPGAMKPAVVAEQLGLHGKAFQSKRWFIQGSSATTGNGIVEGLDWMQRQLAMPKSSSPDCASVAVAKQPIVERAVVATEPKSSGDSAFAMTDKSAAGSASDTDSTADTEAAR